MVLNIIIRLVLFVVVAFLGKFVAAGLISVINPSAGTEITGIVTMSPQPSTTQSGSSLSNSNNVSLTPNDRQTSHKYLIFKDFFRLVRYKNFTQNELLLAKLKLVEILNKNILEKDVENLIQEQLTLVERELN